MRIGTTERKKEMEDEMKGDKYTRARLNEVLRPGVDVDGGSNKR